MKNFKTETLIYIGISIAYSIFSINKMIANTPFYRSWFVGVGINIVFYILIFSVGFFILRFVLSRIFKHIELGKSRVVAFIYGLFVSAALILVLFTALGYLNYYALVWMSSINQLVGFQDLVMDLVFDIKGIEYMTINILLMMFIVWFYAVLVNFYTVINTKSLKA